MRQSRILMFTILVLTAAMLFPAAKRDTQVFPVTAGGGLTLENVNGKIELSTHDREEIRIVLEKVAKSQKELDEVDVRMKLEDNHLKVDVKRLRRDTRTRVNFQVIVPVGLKKVELNSVNGSVRAVGDVGGLEMESVNGAISQRGLFASGRFSTVNGGIEVVHASPLSGGINARSVNGGIQLEIHRSSGFKASGETLNGSVRSDFELKVDKGLVGRSIHGTVGDGKHSVRVKTVNGSIKILAI